MIFYDSDIIMCNADYYIILFSFFQNYYFQGYAILFVLDMIVKGLLNCIFSVNLSYNSLKKSILRNNKSPIEKTELVCMISIKKYQYFLVWILWKKFCPLRTFTSLKEKLVLIGDVKKRKLSFGMSIMRKPLPLIWLHDNTTFHVLWHFFDIWRSPRFWEYIKFVFM